MTPRVQLALFKGDGKLGNAFIRFWTSSQYSHCEIVVAGWCYSSSVMDGGVRRKRVGDGQDQISLSPDKWDLIDVPWADSGWVIEYFDLTDHYRYGWPSLAFSQLFNLNRPFKDAEFCSEWCARALMLPAASSLSPRTLGEWVEHLCDIRRCLPSSGCQLPTMELQQ